MDLVTGLATKKLIGGLIATGTLAGMVLGAVTWWEKKAAAPAMVVQSNLDAHKENADARWDLIQSQWTTDHAMDQVMVGQLHRIETKIEKREGHDGP